MAYFPMLISLSEPPDYFREINIFPDLSVDFTDEVPFFRKNILKYTHVDHYLDVQFRLLREDFLRPLRKGIILTIK